MTWMSIYKKLVRLPLGMGGLNGIKRKCNMKIKQVYNKRGMWLCGFLSFVIGVFCHHNVNGQQDSQFTHYMYNTSTINPAYAGSRGQLGLIGLYRKQWVNLDGAPETINFSVNTPLGLQGRNGLGLTFVQDRIGPSNESTIAADISYYIKVGQRARLAFGVKGGVNLLSVDYSKLNIHNPTDELQQNNIDNRLQPLVGAGLYLHDGEKWYVGASVPNILDTTHYDDSTVSNASERPNFYFIGGYVFDFGPNVRFKPASLIKFTAGAPLAVDLSANFLFYEKFTLGAAYRLDADVSGLVGFQISDGLLLGYAYDHGVQNLRHYNSGSHEVFLRFEIVRGKGKRFITPRFF